MIKVLFIDDDIKAQKNLNLLFHEEIEIFSAYTGTQGLKRIREYLPDVVLLDISLPDLNGIRVLEQINSSLNPPPVIMLTAYNDVQLVVRAIKAGALDYIVKPFKLKELKTKILEAVKSTIRIENRDSGSAFNNKVERIIGENSRIQNIKHIILKYARTNHPVLILGESGTGKEIVAQVIHEISERPGPLIPVNCGAIPAQLVETELFGSEKGAYTDAKSRKGLFQAADNGTILLDEIGEMPKGAQVKLLRVIEQSCVTPVGGCERIPISTRIISATNKNLRQSISINSFREDLYYRLNVLTIELPPLRERVDDIPILAVFFLNQSPYNKNKEKSFCSGALEKLLNYPWPGNIRELKNVIERAIIISEKDRIQPQDIVL
jgi:DNA-binding NtrC family response regulator